MIWIKTIGENDEIIFDCVGFNDDCNGYSPVTLFAPASIALSNNSLTALARSVIACPATILPIAAVGMGRMRRCCCDGSYSYIVACYVRCSGSHDEKYVLRKKFVNKAFVHVW